MAPPDFGRSVTLSQPREADYAHQIILVPPDFQTFRRPWYVKAPSLLCLNSCSNWHGHRVVSTFAHILSFQRLFQRSLLTECLYIYSISLQDKQLNHNTADGVILTNRSLVLQGIDRTRSGGYTCQALNAVGSGQSQVIELDVKCKTFIYYTQ